MDVEPSRSELQPCLHERRPRFNLEVSRLGFGTSALMSRVDRRNSVRLLETALDEGITHFDTARSYGFGEAEWAVGEVLAGRRDRVTVTTKVGILPPRSSAVLSAAKALARRLIHVLPGLRAPMRRSAAGLVTGGRFDASTMTESLQTSLRALRTDYVDLLLLHEPSSEVLARPEPLAFLQRMKKEGKVRHFGLAADLDVVAFGLQQAPLYTDVLQLPNSVFCPALESFSSSAQHAIFTHSIFGTSLSRLVADLNRDPGLANHWCHELQTEMVDGGTIAKLALQWAFATVPHGAVLFTSTKQAHIRENAAVLRTAASAEQIERFEKLVRAWARAGDQQSTPTAG